MKAMALLTSINLLKMPKINKNPVKAMASMGKNKKIIRDSKESLLTGELSDGRHSRKGEADVPKGFLAVYVGPELRRFVISASYLSLPEFRALMERVADEFGFEQEGALKIPYEVKVFEEVLLKCVANNRLKSKSRRNKNKNVDGCV